MVTLTLPQLMLLLRFTALQEQVVSLKSEEILSAGRLAGLPCMRCMLWVHTASPCNNERNCLQVLDDSTCKVTRQLVDEKAAEWAERGIRCDVVRRTNRQGYKAGALKDVSSSPAGHLLALLLSA